MRGLTKFLLSVEKRAVKMVYNTKKHCVYGIHASSRTLNQYSLETGSASALGQGRETCLSDPLENA
jgi:hypothetical protein